MSVDREAFEQYISGWPNFVPKFLERDKSYPDYYKNPVVQGAWEGWKHRGDWDRLAGFPKITP